GWEVLYKISNDQWQHYLAWVGRMAGLAVENDTAVRRLRARGLHLAADLADGRTLHARRVVLATGRMGAGGLSVPAGVDKALWPHLAAHTGEAIDLAALAGKRVAVMGAGASAWDGAAAALEHGAARVDMYCRRAILPQINKGRGSTNPGFHEGWPALSDAERWALLVYLNDVQGPPPHESVHRALAHAGFHLHLATPIRAAWPENDRVRLDLPGGRTSADFLICATGYAIDLDRQPELDGLAPLIATWADRYIPPPALVRPELGRFPYLGPDFACAERVPGTCPALAHLHLFGHSAFASMGAIASDIPGVSTAAERLSSRLASSLFAEDLPAMRTALEAFDEPELESTPFFVR
ncbi:MAG TPA: NAD(P)-binding domain-containing protein, partial [Acetobacteraceae bacterium]